MPFTTDTRKPHCPIRIVYAEAAGGGLWVEETGRACRLEAQ